MKQFFAAMLALAWMGGQSAAAAPNIVMIVADDHAWTDYGFLGHPHVRTPHLDALARQSLSFARGYVPSSLCCPSLASMITGRYAHQHRITSNDPPLPPGLRGPEFHRSREFRQGRQTMIEHMLAAAPLPARPAPTGYLSMQTGKWWQGSYHNGGFTQGMTEGQRHGDKGLVIGRETMQPAFDFVRQAQDDGRPFFLWYAPLMPHDPHTAPERLIARYRPLTPSVEVARYWASIEWFDETVGQLLGYLDARGLRDDTLVVYLADNGWIQDPDTPRHAPKSKQSPYDGGLRTPILVRWPSRVPPQASPHLALSIDLVPTILAALGLAPALDLPGINLLDAQSASRRQAIFGECFTHNAVDLQRPAANLRWRWMIDGSWKLIVPGVNEPDGRVELYDLAGDPGEEVERSAEQPQRVADMRARLDAWWNPTPAGR